MPDYVSGIPARRRPRSNVLLRSAANAGLPSHGCVVSSCARSWPPGSSRTAPRAPHAPLDIAVKTESAGSKIARGRSRRAGFRRVPFAADRPPCRCGQAGVVQDPSDQCPNEAMLGSRGSRRMEFRSDDAVAGDRGTSALAEARIPWALSRSSAIAVANSMRASCEPRLDRCRRPQYLVGTGSRPASLLIASNRRCSACVPPLRGAARSDADVRDEDGCAP